MAKINDDDELKLTRKLIAAIDREENLEAIMIPLLGIIAICSMGILFIMVFGSPPWHAYDFFRYITK